MVSTMQPLLTSWWASVSLYHFANEHNSNKRVGEQWALWRVHLDYKNKRQTFWRHWWHMIEIRGKDTGLVSLAPPCSPGSQLASSCLWSRTALPQLTRPPGPGCPCDHGRPAWSIGQLGTHRQCWAAPRTGGPLVLPQHHSLKLRTKTSTGWKTEQKLSSFKFVNIWILP